LGDVLGTRDAILEQMWQVVNRNFHGSRFAGDHIDC